MADGKDSHAQFHYFELFELLSLNNIFLNTGQLDPVSLARQNQLVT